MATRWLILTKPHGWASLVSASACKIPSWPFCSLQGLLPEWAVDYQPSVLRAMLAKTSTGLPGNCEGSRELINRCQWELNAWNEDTTKAGSRHSPTTNLALPGTPLVWGAVMRVLGLESQAQIWVYGTVDLANLSETNPSAVNEKNNPCTIY